MGPSSSWLLSLMVLSLPLDCALWQRGREEKVRSRAEQGATKLRGSSPAEAVNRTRLPVTLRANKAPRNRELTVL